MSKVVTVGATALFACILCATPSRFARRPRETWRCPWTAPQRRLVVPSLQEALPAFIAGHIGALIGADTMGTMDTDTGHTSRRTDMGTRTSRPLAMAITSNPILGMAPGTCHGGRSDRAISIIGEAPWAARS